VNAEILGRSLAFGKKICRERRYRPWLIAGLALLLGVVIVATRPKVTPVTVKEKAWPVRVQLAEPGQWAPSLTLYGRVESLWSSQLTAGITADVLEVKVLEGDDVQKGALLIQLDDRDARLLLAQRKAELAEVEANLQAATSQFRANQENLPREQQLLKLSQAEADRLRGLVEAKLASQSSLDKAVQDVERQAISVRSREQTLQGHEATLLELQARRAKAEALRDQAQLELERTQVSAPFPARIAKIAVSPGKRVKSGDPLVQLYDTSAMVVRAQVPNRYLIQVRQAMKEGVALKVAGTIDEAPLQASLLRLAGETGSGGGVEALFAIQEGELFEQGRFVRLDLTLPEQDGLVAVPPEALYGTDRLYQLDAEERMRPLSVVRVGELRDASQRSLILVRSDEIKAGARLVTTQLPNAIDGLLVKPATLSSEDKITIVAPASQGEQP
jgi:multidrug efflux pump subunit AcrA (membrane-fusion protein)